MCNNCVEEIIEAKDDYKVVRVDGKVKIKIDRTIPEFDESVELKPNAMLLKRPELYSQWYFEKNNELGLDIYKVTYGSNMKVWWICSDCGSPYDISLKNRCTNNQNCPYCRALRINITNCLASTHPELAKEWHPTLNEKSPYEITYGYDKKVWWLCKDCGSDFDNSPNCRTNNKQNCPYCSGMRVNETNSLASLRPDIARQWHPTKNGDLTSHNITCGNTRINIWWLGDCGHEWESTVSNRNRGDGCPYCNPNNPKLLIGFNDMWTVNPQLASMLANPDDGYRYTEGSDKKVNWKCQCCGDIIRNRIIYSINKQGLSCPNCNNKISYPEKIMYNLLKQLDVEFDYNSTKEWSNKKMYDFYIEYNGLKIITETHGLQHYDEGFKNLGGRTLQEEQENDAYKRELALQNGIDKYIELDCQYSDLEYIKTSILQSELVDIFNLENINWEKLHVDSLKTINLEILRLWNEEDLTFEEISNKVKLYKTTVMKILKKFDKLGLCKYDRCRTLRKFNKQTNNIYQFTMDMDFIKIWRGSNEIKNELGIQTSSISQCCNGKRNHAGNFIWRYEKDLIGWSVPLHNDK